MEKIEAVRQSPKWTSKATIRIDETKDRAVEEEQRRMGDRIRVYSDGSGIEGMIGAAAVLYRGGELKGKLRYQLGSEKKHTMYEGEGVGMILGLELIRKEANARRVTIGIDNQPGICAVITMQSTPSHYIWDLFHNQLRIMLTKHQNLEIQIRWTPGHIGIDGNEEADKEAKQAAVEGSSPQQRLPKALRKKLPYSRSAAKQAFMAKLKQKARKEWERSPRYQRIHKYDDSMPSPKYTHLIKPLRQKHASILYQLRTGHIPLAKHLHHIAKADTPRCPCCGQEEETIHHFLFRCSAHREARQAMTRAAGIDAMDLNKLLSEKTLIPHLLKFISATGRLHTVFGNIPDIEESNNK